MNVLEMLDELESELSDRKGFFSKKTDLDKCYSLVCQIKQSLPAVLREAEYVMESKRKILENADSVAKNMIREAEERAGHFVEKSEIVRLAQDEARKITDEAYRNCEELVRKTKEHLDVMFRDAEEFLISNINMIRTNRDELRAVVVPSVKR